MNVVELVDGFLNLDLITRVDFVTDAAIPAPQAKYVRVYMADGQSKAYPVEEDVKVITKYLRLLRLNQ